MTNQRGFTLMEAVLAASVLAIMTGGIVVLLNITVRSGASIEHRIQAYQMLQEAFENARNTRDSAWIDGIANNWDVKLNSTSENKIVGKSHFKVETTISAINDDEKKVEVSIKDATNKEILAGSTILTNWIKP